MNSEIQIESIKVKREGWIKAEKVSKMKVMVSKNPNTLKQKRTKAKPSIINPKIAEKELK